MKINEIVAKDFFEALLAELGFVAKQIKNDPATYYRILVLHDRLADISGKPHLKKIKRSANER